MATIYVIFHDIYENTNIFTLDLSKVKTMIKEMENNYPGTEGQWRHKAIEENKHFEANFEWDRLTTFRRPLVSKYL